MINDLYTNDLCLNRHASNLECVLSSLFIQSRCFPEAPLGFRVAMKEARACARLLGPPRFANKGSQPTQ